MTKTILKTNNFDKSVYRNNRLLIEGTTRSGTDTQEVINKFIARGTTAPSDVEKIYYKLTTLSTRDESHKKWRNSPDKTDNNKIFEFMKQAGLSKDEIAEVLERWMDEDAPPASPPQPSPPPAPKDMTLSDLLGLLAKVNAKTMTEAELKAEWDKLTPENQKSLEDEMKKIKAANDAENARISGIIKAKINYIKGIIDHEKNNTKMTPREKQKLITKKQNII